MEEKNVKKIGQTKQREGENKTWMQREWENKMKMEREK